MAEISVIDLPLMAYSELTPNDRVLIIDDGSLKQFTWENLLTFIQSNVQGEKGDQGVSGRDGRDGTNGTNGTNGANGLSAYQVAVNNGFSGSATDWLNSLKGTAGTNGTNGTNGWTPIVAIASDGDRRVIQVTSWVGGTGTPPVTGYYGSTGIVSNIANAVNIRGEQGIGGLQGAKGDKGDKGDAGAQGIGGLSSYQVAVQEGFTGDVDEWLLSLKGTNGISAYQVAVNNGFSGTESEWILSLKGADGTDGINGTNGANGLSAYQVAVNNGFVGTESEWLLSLKGADGDPADVLSTILTGLDAITATGGVLDTDTVLEAFAKIRATLTTLTAPPDYGDVTDVGGEGYYPYAESDGDLYTTTQDITIPAGFYRIIACGAYNLSPTDEYSITRVIRDLTGELLLMAGSSSNVYGGTQLSSAALPISSPNSQDGKKGWRDDIATGSTLLKYLFSTAPDINKGTNGLKTSDLGSFSGSISLSGIIHFVEPTLLHLQVGQHKNYSSLNMAAAGTGFVWIREVTP